MKLHRVFLIALMTSAFAVLGCGGGSESASSVCSACDAPDRIPACEQRYDECRALDRAGEECAVVALEQCGAL
jgi:hypothetical protein